MLNNIRNLSYRRNSSEAVVFYLVYLLVGIVVSALGAGIITSIISNSDKEFFLKISSLIIVVFVFNLGFMLLGAKKMTEESKYVVTVVTASFLAYFGGGLLGLVLIAYLTTKGQGGAPLEEVRVDPDIPPPSL